MPQVNEFSWCSLYLNFFPFFIVFFLLFHFFPPLLSMKPFYFKSYNFNVFF